jgi:hypothetical protein
MFRVHYRRPESLRLHQRDFPPRRLSDDREASPWADGSYHLALMVVVYLLATVSGIIFLGHLTTAATTDIATAETTAAR